jgi:hypothetical protein
LFREEEMQQVLLVVLQEQKLRLARSAMAHLVLENLQALQR